MRRVHGNRLHAWLYNHHYQMKLRNIIIGFVLVAAMMIAGACTLLHNLTPLFERVNSRIAEGRTVVINSGVKASALDSMLLICGYVNDPVDSKLISSHYADLINGGQPLENLGAINSRRFAIPVDTIEARGGTGLRSRLAADIATFGQDSIWASLNTAALPSIFGSPSTHTALITARVTASNDTADIVYPVSGVVVRLTRHTVIDTIPSASLAVSLDSHTVGYAITDNDGVARFYAPKGHSYSVLPIEKNYTFGSEKGTAGNTLTTDLPTLTFSREKIKLRPFSQALYGLMKKDLALVSRTPAQYTEGLTSGVAIFLFSWLAVFLLTILIDRHTDRRSDFVILFALMVLSGLGLLTLYGQMLPLTDIYNAVKMSRYIALGCLALVVFSCINYLKLYQRYRAIWLGKMKFGGGALRASLPGMPFLMLALLLMVALRLVGSGPEGSDARVNLGFFQPSEVVKYLVLLFIVFFFVGRGEAISAFSRKLTIIARRRQLAIVGVILAVIALVSLLFLGMLKDMGPGVVILATFIMLYSVVRRDFPQLMLGIISYVAIVGGAYMLTASMAVHIASIGLWFVLWIAGWYIHNKTVCESAIFFNSLISLFLVGGYLLQPVLPHMAARLFNRTNMAWSGIFDNAVPQGDQIAQGLWGTASGGISGMGFGGGSAHFIPAGHTDLILCSLGEQAGWLGILLVCICMFILISRTASAAQYSAHRFTLYLCLGIGLLTGVQFLFIALGSVGAIPLSGVPVPFLSYSGTGIVMALAAYGIVMSISRHPGTREACAAYVVNERRTTENDDSANARSLERNLIAGMTLFLITIAAVACVNGYYQIIADNDTKLRPAITSTSRGLRVLDYNPRIKAVIERLELGNIYDRNNLLLATTSRNDLDSMTQVLNALKIDTEIISKQRGKHLKRYYPLGNNTVFIVGDLNRPDVYGNGGMLPTGLYAENEYADLLRGYQSPSEAVCLKSSQYSVSRFTPTVSNICTKGIKHDYTALLPALSQPLYNNRWIDDFNSRRNERDLYLSIDGALQTDLSTRMADALQNDAKYHPYANCQKYMRASVVLLDATTGELLSSANYPLPEPDSILSLIDHGYDHKAWAPSEWREGPPVTDRDLGMTYFTPPGSTAKVLTAIAGLQKLGTGVKDLGFEIQPFMTIEPPTREPNIANQPMNRNGRRTTFIDDAIKYSSNCFFIMLLNNKDLYTQLGNVYSAVGASVNRNYTYIFNPGEFDIASQEAFRSTIAEYRTSGLKEYANYMANAEVRRNSMSDIQSHTGIAWGQSTLEATPLTMARAASAVANGGKLMPTRYLRVDAKNEQPLKGFQLLDAASNAVLYDAMHMEASRHFKASPPRLPEALDGMVGGKTGTPERAWTKEGNYNGKINDAWYMCFINPGAGKHPIAIAVRLERTQKTSSLAVNFVNDVVIPSLQKFNYIK